VETHMLFSSWIFKLNVNERSSFLCKDIEEKLKTQGRKSDAIK